MKRRRHIPIGIIGILGALLGVCTATSGVDRFVIKDHADGDGDYLSWET